MVSSEEEDLCNLQASESEDEGPYGFKRNKSCQYNLVSVYFGVWEWVNNLKGGMVLRVGAFNFDNNFR